MKNTINCIYTFILIVALYVMYSSVTDANILDISDPLRSKQRYLDEIKLDSAMKYSNVAKAPLIVAVIDTGVDFFHPDLKGQFVKGINLLVPESEPIDDNGHGTNVAGIISAKANNNIGITGIDPSVKIMPIKALDQDGKGEEKVLMQSIEYATKHGAKIIVLSLGLNTYSKELDKLLDTANSKGILVIAAVGNEGSQIKYPAAYRSVLSVGGVSNNKKKHYLSNSGQELDIVAPWDVFTTDLGGGYIVQSGSSMTAPQVAGVAALLFGKYPNMTPDEIKNKILQSTEDIEEVGWDKQTGYGFLRADLALSLGYKKDRFEPNNTKLKASKISSDTEFIGSFASTEDQDWFKVNCDYDGYLEVIFSETITTLDKLSKTLLVTSDASFELDSIHNRAVIKVKKGDNFFYIKDNRTNFNEINYKLKIRFMIYVDDYENNDKPYKAYTLLERMNTISGTFHKENDEDWFVIKATKPGTIRLEASADTPRIDLKLTIQKKGEIPTICDQSGGGETESSPLLYLDSGEYYIQIKNSLNHSNPITGEYKMVIIYSERIIDPFEPNNKTYQSTTLQPNKIYKGTFDTLNDIDWYNFKIDKESVILLEINNIMKNQKINVDVLDKDLKVVRRVRNISGLNRIYISQKVYRGIQFIRLGTDQPMYNQYYSVSIKYNLSK